MLTAIVLAVAISGLFGQALGPRLAISSLTVPPERLPQGCSLWPWNFAPLIESNPWAGTDRSIVAQIRERLDGPTLVPDGPPLNSRELARFRLHLAEGVEEGYAAIYTQSEVGTAMISVIGLRFANVERVDSVSSGPKNPNVIRVAIGSIVAAVHGDGGPCFQAIGAHLRSLAK